MCVKHAVLLLAEFEFSKNSNNIFFNFIQFFDIFVPIFCSNSLKLMLLLLIISKVQMDGLLITIKLTLERKNVQIILTCFGEIICLDKRF